MEEPEVPVRAAVVDAGTARSSYGLQPPDLTPAAYKKILENGVSG